MEEDDIAPEKSLWYMCDLLVETAQGSQSLLAEIIEEAKTGFACLTPVTGIPPIDRKYPRLCEIPKRVKRSVDAIKEDLEVILSALETMDADLLRIWGRR